LELKEYWLNVDEGSINYNKYLPFNIPFDLKQKGINKRITNMLPSTKYKKTNLFALFYDINKESGEFDEFGLPIVEDAFQFTNEEVLIKLFALKNYLKNKFLPLNARILDIVGEGVYFERYRVNTWSDGTNIISVDLTRQADFKCVPEEPLIVDLRILEDFDFSPISTNPSESTILSDIKNVILAYFDNINDTENLPDEPNLPVGAPCFLTASAFAFTWNDWNNSWDSMYYDFREAVAEVIIDGTGTIIGTNIIDGGSGYITAPTIELIGGNPTVPGDITAEISGGKVTNLIINVAGSGYASKPNLNFIGGAPVSVINTWDTLDIGDFYEAEWIVTAQLPNVFEYRKRGRIDELKTHLVILPFTGLYDVELILYDTDNNYVNQIKKSCINVKMPQIEFTTFGRYRQCYTDWDSINDVSWDELNTIWLQPTHHKELTWDDLVCTWNDLDFNLYTNQLENVFPALVEKEVLRISETDRLVGNLIEIDYNTNQLTIEDPVIKPEVETGDYIYLKQDDNKIRAQVSATEYSYLLEQINVLVGGAYKITTNFATGDTTVPGDWTPITPQNRPVIVIDPPISGTQALATITLDGVVEQPNVNVVSVANGKGYNKTVSGTTAVSILGAPAGFVRYNVVFSNPEDPLGTVAEGLADFNNTFYGFAVWVGGSFINGSGYNSPPAAFKIYDNNGDEVTNQFYGTPEDLYFEITIKGPISAINLVEPGSGYTSIPNHTIYPDVSAEPFLTNGEAEVVMADIADKTILTVDTLPLGINPTWDVLRELGQTILIEGDCIFDSETNLNGLSIGNWLKLRNAFEPPKYQRLPIADQITNNLNLATGIEIAGNYVDLFRDFEKCKIYRERTLNFGLLEFSVDAVNNQITIINPGFDVRDELIAGYHILSLDNRDSLIPGAPIIYTQRLLIENIEESGVDYILTVQELDGSLDLFNNDGASNLIYEYWEFPVVIDDITFDGVNTELVLNLNDWPFSDKFDAPVNDWYFDYGIMEGDWALQITDIGYEGSNTLVTVDDPNSELWQSSSSFLLAWRNFDEDYAERRLGTDILIWNNFDEITWDDLCHLSWNQLEYTPNVLCGFQITDVAPGGRVQWNEEPVFEFEGITGLMTTAQKINQAVLELNETDNSGLSRFDYRAMPDDINPTYIMATAKTYSGDNLGYLRFSNGVTGEYVDPTLSHTYPLNNTYNADWQSGYYGPNNNPANWNITIRLYQEFGVDPIGVKGWYPSDVLQPEYASVDELWKSQRIPYLPALGNNLSWNDMFVSPRNTEVPIYTTLFFSASNCKVAGKTGYRWSVIDVNRKEVLVETIKPYLIWTFTRESEYDIALEIVDTNSNVQSKTRQGFVRTFKATER
jgi:hypothetical protein